jgi:hypothetical protein
MSRLLERHRAQAEIASVRALLAQLNGSRALERIGLEARAEELEAQLAATAPTRSPTAEVTLLFGGAPVFGTSGIEARFATAAIGSYQEMISCAAAVKVGGPLGVSGPIPLERASRLHVTNVAHASFGFELRELVDEQLLLGETALAKVVDEVNTLVTQACQGDDEFADATERIDQRVYTALHSFLSTVQKARASFKIASHATLSVVTHEMAARAAERAEAVRQEQEDLPVRGVFLGVLLDSKRFEHRAENGDVVRGRAAPNANIDALSQWVGKPCVAHLRVVTWERVGKIQRRYTLQRLEAIGRVETVS